MYKPYAASSTIDGTEFAHTYYAPTQEDAERIAEENGWRFEGEIIDEIWISDEELAEITGSVKPETVH